MKKLLFVSLLVNFVFTTFAQLSEGRSMIGGSFSFSKNQTNDNDTSYNKYTQVNKRNNFNGSLNYGYFIKDNLMLGAFGSYGSNTNSSNMNYIHPNSGYYRSSNTYRSILFSGGLFLRYYKMLGNSKFALFANLSSSFGGGNYTQYIVYKNSVVNDTITTDTKGKISSLRIAINPGLVYFLTKNIAIETSFGGLGYDWGITKNYARDVFIGDSKSSGFNSNLSVSLSSIFLGVNFYFGGKQTKNSVRRN